MSTTQFDAKHLPPLKINVMFVIQPSLEFSQQIKTANTQKKFRAERKREADVENQKSLFDKKLNILDFQLAD